jgi:hypothetical protein
MKQQLKNITISAVLVASLSAATFSHSAPAPCPRSTEGVSIGLGAGVKLISLKNIVTQTTGAGVVTRSGDAMSNLSSPVIGFYVRKYMPDLLFVPTFVGFEFEYLTDVKKTNIHTSFNNAGGSPDTGYRYREKFDSRLMLGAQLLACSQVDFWGQVGLQVTNFDYEGITRDPNNLRFPMDNNLALAPAGGLEMRFSRPNLVMNGAVTDFILGWTAAYRNAFAVTGTARGVNNYNFAMSSNWSHTFGLKVMFRF